MLLNLPPEADCRDAVADGAMRGTCESGPLLVPLPKTGWTNLESYRLDLGVGAVVAFVERVSKQQ